MTDSGPTRLAILAMAEDVLAAELEKQERCKECVVCDVVIKKLKDARAQETEKLVDDALLFYGF